MDHPTCPGAKLARQPKPEEFACPTCGREVEIWTDELSRTCSDCGTVVLREDGVSCLEWCAMAEDCVGRDTYDDFKKRRAGRVRDGLMDVAKRHTANERLIERAVVNAERIARTEKADLHIVLAASVLRIVFGNRRQHAREVLFRLGFQTDDVEEVCSLLDTGEKTSHESSCNERAVDRALILSGVAEGAAATDDP